MLGELSREPGRPAQSHLSRAHGGIAAQQATEYPAFPTYLYRPTIAHGVLRATLTSSQPVTLLEGHRGGEPGAALGMRPTTRAGAGVALASLPRRASQLLQKCLDSLIDHLGLVYVRPMRRMLDHSPGGVWNTGRHVV